MSKSKFKHYSVFTALFFYSSVFSQFNTVMPMQPKKTENQKILEKSKEKEKDNPNQKNNQKSWKEVFKITTKSDLKKELDSLKNQMCKLSITKNEEKKFDFKKIEDSLIKIMKENSRNTNDLGRPMRQFNFLEDLNLENNFDSKINMPLNNKMIVTSPFGTRFHPIFGTQKMHNGTDFKANYENVYAVLDGTITEAGWDSGGGNYIKIRHSDSFVSSYLHLSQIYYKAGEFVKAGFIIAKSGNSGNSTGPHLHFTVTENGKYINPVRFLNDLIKANNLIATYYAK